MYPMTTELPDVLTTGQLAQRWGTSQVALRLLRSRGTGPEFVKFGETAVYLVSTIEAWEQAYGRNGRRPRRTREAVA